MTKRFLGSLESTDDAGASSPRSGTPVSGKHPEAMRFPAELTVKPVFAGLTITVPVNVCGSANKPSVVNPDPTVMVSSASSLLNAKSPMLTTESGIVICFNCGPAKAFVPIAVRLDGKLISVIFRSPSNAESLIVVKFGGSFTFVRFELLLKA